MNSLDKMHIVGQLARYQSNAEIDRTTHKCTLTNIDEYATIGHMKTTSTRLLPILNQDVCTPSITVTLMSPERAVRLANQLRALADPTRLRMLDLIVRLGSAVCVCDITAQFEQHQPTISHHLRLLREAGLVDCEKRGVWAYYWATEAGKEQLAMVRALA